MVTDAISSILAVLEAVSSEIPFPGVATAVKAASALMQACGVRICSQRMMNHNVDLR